MQEKLGWDPIMDGDNIIGLGEQSGMGAISIEPGGQFELSGAPLENLHQTLPRIEPASGGSARSCRADGHPVPCIGGSPKWTLAETPRMPKSR